VFLCNIKVKTVSDHFVKKEKKNLCMVRDLIHTQHHHNNHTTIPHMSVGPSVWGPPSCEGLLCGCCVGDVNLTFSVWL